MNNKHAYVFSKSETSLAPYETFHTASSPWLFTRVFSRRGSVEESGSVGPPRVWPGQARRGGQSAAV